MDWTLQNRFFEAIDTNKIKLMKELIHQGADVNICGDNGYRPLSWALVVGYEEIACALIQAGADLNQKSPDGQTPLHLAVEHGYLDIAKTLIKKGVYVNY